MSHRNTVAVFETKYIPEPNSGCWIWLGYLLDNKPLRQYGRISWYDEKQQRQRMKLAHVLSYEIYVGELPEGKVLDHLCRNPTCVNPQHLEPVTQRINMERSAPATKTHCRNGHPYADGVAHYQHAITGQKYRRCLTCYRLKYPGTKV